MSHPWDGGARWEGGGNLKSSTLTGHSTAGPRAHYTTGAQNRLAACGHSDLDLTFIPNHCEQDMVKEWSWYLEPPKDIWAI